MVKFNRLHKTIPYHLHKNIVLLNLYLLRSIYKNKPVPLSYWIKYSSIMNHLFPSSKHICPHPTTVESTGESIDVPELKSILRDETLGGWSMDKSSIKHIWNRILLSQPKFIAEYGAGVSTLVLARYSEKFYELNSYLPTIISLEQSIYIKKSIEERLKHTGLDDRVIVIHNPISDAGNYLKDTSEIKKILRNNKIDLILIDGPSGPPGCRANTIFYLSEFCMERTKWFLDDSFRNGELHILNQWNKTPGIEVEGIYPIGKGLGTGIIKIQK